MDRIRLNGKRKSKYTDAQRDVCDTCWNAAQRNAEVRHSVNTRVTYESVFTHSKRELAKVGVRTLSMFKAILHSRQSVECAQRKRNLEAKAEAERKAKRNAKPRKR